MTGANHDANHDANHGANHDANRGANGGGVCASYGYGMKGTWRAKTCVPIYVHYDGVRKRLLEFSHHKTLF
jgi:hypothetical protein